MPGTFAYDTGTNTITVTGGTPSSPADFASMYAADQAGGWGVVTNPEPNTYRIASKLNIGDGSTSTFFKDTLKNLVIPSGVITGNSQTYCDVKSNATFQLGDLIDETKKVTKDGCQMDFQEGSYYSTKLFYAHSGLVNLYSASFMISGGFSGRCVITESGGTAIAWNCFIIGCLAFLRVLNGDIFNIISCYSSSTINQCSCSINNVNLVGSPYYMIEMYSNYQTIAKNITSRSPNTAFLRPSAINVDQYIIDADTDEWSILWGSTCTGKIYRQNTINLHITDKDGNDIAGATVTLKDNGGSTVFSVSTGADGKITEQTVSRGYYDQAHSQTLQDYGPHTLTITKDGYQDYQDVITLDRKLDLEVALTYIATVGVGVTPTNLGLVPLGIKQVAV
jgi:hypothetical protein